MQSKEAASTPAEQRESWALSLNRQTERLLMQSEAHDMCEPGHSKMIYLFLFLQFQAESAAGVDRFQKNEDAEKAHSSGKSLFFLLSHNKQTLN